MDRTGIWYLLCLNSIMSVPFLVVKKLLKMVHVTFTTYCCRARRPSVRLSSVEIISFRCNSLSNRQIDLKSA